MHEACSRVQSVVHGNHTLVGAGTDKPLAPRLVAHIAGDSGIQTLQKALSIGIVLKQFLAHDVARSGDTEGALWELSQSKGKRI